MDAILATGSIITLVFLMCVFFSFVHPDCQTWKVLSFDEENGLMKVQIKMWIFGSKFKEIFNVNKNGSVVSAVWENGRGLSSEQKKAVDGALIVYREKQKIWESLEKQND